MEKFESRKLDVETLPEYLKDTRESFFYDLNTVSRRTEISEKFLQALETGSYHKLPADVYVYGFLRKLGRLYRVDSTILIEQYNKERGVHDKVHTANYNKNKGNAKQFNISRLVITPKTLIISFMVLFVVCTLGYLIYQVREINKPPSIVILEPSDGQVLTTSNVLIKGHVDPGSTISLENNPIDTDSSGNFNKIVSVSPGQTVFDFTAKNNFGKMSTKQISIVADYQENTQLNPTAISQGVQIKVVVGPGSAELTIQIDDNPAVTDNLQAGDTKTYTGQNKIILGTNNAGSTDVTVNGKDNGKLGREGESLSGIVFQ